MLSDSTSSAHPEARFGATGDLRIERVAEHLFVAGGCGLSALMEAEARTEISWTDTRIGKVHPIRVMTRKREPLPTSPSLSASSVSGAMVFPDDPPSPIRRSHAGCSRWIHRGPPVRTIAVTSYDVPFDDDASGACW